MARLRHRANVVAVAGLCAVIAAGYFAATANRREPSVTTVTEDVRPRAASAEPPAPPGMVTLPALGVDLGSSDDEIADALAWCRTLVTSGGCRPELYARERPVRRVHVSAIALDVHERSNAEVAAWLSRLRELHEDQGWLVAGETRLVEVGDDRDLRVRDHAVVARAGTERLPAVYITYDGARRFCRARGLELPTEAQWERAARGAARRRFPWGDAEPTCDHAVYGGGPGGPCPRRGRTPIDATTRDRTPEGIVHLGGNVAEWVLDRYVDGGDVTCRAPCVDPVVAATDDPHEPHVIRGGAFESLAEQLRGAGRARAPRNAAFGNTGFRCAAPASRSGEANP